MTFLLYLVVTVIYKHFPSNLARFIAKIKFWEKLEPPLPMFYKMTSFEPALKILKRQLVIWAILKVDKPWITLSCSSQKHDFLKKSTMSWEVLKPWLTCLKCARYSIPMVRRSSVVVHTLISVRRVSVDKILYVSSFGLGKDSLRFWAILWFPRQQKSPIDLKWGKCCPENLIGSSSHLQVTRTAVKSRTSSILGQIGLFTSELFVLDRRKFSHRMLSGR